MSKNTDAAAHVRLNPRWPLLACNGQDNAVRLAVELSEELQVLAAESSQGQAAAAGSVPVE